MRTVRERWYSTAPARTGDGRRLERNGLEELHPVGAGNKQILFYTSPASFDILPTGNMEAAQLAELREMLKTNIHSES